ncbi:MAG TPA: hypothetical protein VGO64_05655 [Candidatus Limnocylindrales bacterium]|jgi:hypothetical protein|nr:hypothetical protein [Candidatus Limnocylindrales bacterium]
MPDRPFQLPFDPRIPALVGLIAVLAACSGAGPSAGASGSGAPTGSAAPSPSAPGASPSAVPSITPAPTVAGIDHSTAAGDVVLRLEQGGGFVPIDFLASQAPMFTLYGDGVVVFQPKVELYPQPDPSGVIHGIPWRTAKLDEGQIQQLLEFVLGPGGLGTARDAYIDGRIADAPNTIFTIHAGGLDKTVVVNALGGGGQPGPDDAARAAFLKVAGRLGDFDQGGTVSTDEYATDRYRFVLTQRDAQPTDRPMAWPWPTLKVSDFKPGANDASGGIALPHRVGGQADVDALGLKDTAGGLQGLVVKGPDGKTYGLVVRPLLADETA